VSNWEVFLSEYGPLSRHPVGSVEAKNSVEAMDLAWPLYGHLCEEENRYLVVMGIDEPPPRPTVWSRLRQWEI
jgi:hypothetical protein